MSGSFILNLFDLCTKPLANFSLELCLIVLELQILDGFSITIQRNEMTRHFFRAVFRGDEFEQPALGVIVFTIRIDRLTGVSEG